MRKNTKIDVWKFIDKKEANECWIWIGSTFSGRYGRFFLDGKALCAHRVVYEVANGEIDNGLFVMHKCNNKLCCNPSHLTVGTNSENQRHASMSNAFSTGKTGIRGVGFDEKRGYWYSHGYMKGKRFMLYQGPHKDKALEARHLWESQNGITFNIDKGKQNEAFY